MSTFLAHNFLSPIVVDVGVSFCNTWRKQKESNPRVARAAFACFYKQLRLPSHPLKTKAYDLLWYKTYWESLDQSDYRNRNVSRFNLGDPNETTQYILQPCQHKAIACQLSLLANYRAYLA